MSDRVVLFLDYQNVYMSARERFFRWGAPHWYGQIDPLALAKLLVDRSPFDREVHGVRIYRGRPSPHHAPYAAAAWDRQLAAWERQGITVIWQALKYQPGKPAREKGIDVLLALDFVVMAMNGDYDVGSLMSQDYDLRPALRYVAAKMDLGGPRAEVAAWGKPKDSSLYIKERKLWCHWLGEADFHAVADDRDYTRP